MSDDLMAELGVALPPSEPRKPRGRLAPVRHTEWSNAKTFEFTGYMAKVRRIYCATCEGTHEVLEGIFSCELHVPSGTRRLTSLGKGAQWPAQGTHKLEVAVERVAWCVLCIRDLGFSNEVPAPGTYSLEVEG